MYCIIYYIQHSILVHTDIKHIQIQLKWFDVSLSVCMGYYIVLNIYCSTAFLDILGVCSKLLYIQQRHLKRELIAIPFSHDGNADGDNDDCDYLWKNNPLPLCLWWILFLSFFCTDFVESATGKRLNKFENIFCETMTQMCLYWNFLIFQFVN